MTKFNKYQYVELLIQPGQASVSFTPQQYLLNRQIYGCEVFNNGDFNQAQSSYDLVTPAMMAGMSLTFYCTDTQLPLQQIPNSTQYNGQGWGYWHRNVPLVAMHRVSSGSNSYVRDFYEMFGEFIDFEQSNVNISPTSQALITTGGVPVVVLFGISYK